MPSFVKSSASTLLLATALIGGCSGESGPTELALSHVPSNELGTVPAGSYVFRTQSDWQAFWTVHPHGGYPMRQVPTVDFAGFAVAGISAGSKGRCNRLDIVGGNEFQGSVTLRYRIVTFGQGTPSSCIGEDPFTLNLADFVLVPKEATEVKFEAE